MDGVEFFMTLILGIAIGFLFTFISWEAYHDSFVKTRSVQCGCAHYDNQTGKFVLDLPDKE